VRAEKDGTGEVRACKKWKRREQKRTSPIELSSFCSGNCMMYIQPKSSCLWRCSWRFH